MGKHLLIGLSTRALAESAVKGGNEILTLDHFGDRDQKELVLNHSLARDYRLPFSAENLVKASENLVFDRVTYTANLENHPGLVFKLARRAKLVGNTPETLRTIRDWKMLREFFRNNSVVTHPVTLLPGEEGLASADILWLLKPTRGGGGHSIRYWDRRQLSDCSILQAYVSGIPASAAFVANGRLGVLLGLTRQLIGHSELGGDGFAWCGNITPLNLNRDQKRLLCQKMGSLVNSLTHHFRLRGVGGIDFILTFDEDGQPEPVFLEVNPRYTGSMELIEQAYGLNMFALHEAGCDGHLPEFHLKRQVENSYHGKGIVFVRREIFIESTDGWSDSDRRDIPFAGDRIKQGQPVCTIFSQANSEKQCLARLFVHADALRSEIRDIRG